MANHTLGSSDASGSSDRPVNGSRPASAQDRRIGYILLAAAFLSACSNAASSPGAPATRAIVLDLAGVRPGMTVDEARSILEAKGFAVSVKPHRSYENAVADAVAKRNGIPTGVEADGKGVRELDAKKGGEELTAAEIAPSPGQGTLLSITFSSSTAGRSKADMRSDVQKRFGPPTVTFSPTYMGWCASGDTCRPRSNREPMLVYDDGSPIVTILGLDGGSAARAAAEGRFAAAVAQRVGKPKSSF